ncbi:MAG: SH3 domain-containing protein [Acidimicrobiales bacterium]|nr:SH3 domain-containing protein [Acidimicrobiales bacterium]
MGVVRSGLFRWLGLVVVGLALLTGCGSDDETTTSSTAATTTSEVSTTSSEPDTTTSTTTSDTTTTGSVTSSTASSTTDAPTTTTASTTTAPTTPTLPGEPFEGFIEAGDELGVMGVAFDDVLNVRASPGTDQPIIATLAPTAEGVVATGEERRLSSIWYEIQTDSGTGWVGSSFVAYVGAVDDATAEYLAAGGPTEAETIAELGELVAAEYASEDPASRIVQTVAPSTGDLNEVTYDVVGLGDDSGAGYRLHLFVLESEDGEGFVLRTIERTAFCSRGLSGELCV